VTTGESWKLHVTTFNLDWFCISRRTGYKNIITLQAIIILKCVPSILPT